MNGADVVVVGGGLAGMTAAADLCRAGLSVAVLEARDRVGGRLLTVEPERGPGDGATTAWFDLGATWVWDDQPEVLALARDLGIGTFPQHRDGMAVSERSAGEAPATVDLAPPAPAELRLRGGAQGLCRRLDARVPPGTVVTGTSVVSISAAGGPGGLIVAATGPGGDDVEWRSRFAVVALPPRLALERISFAPALPDDLLRVMKGTTTWMATAVKCVVVYEAPFWRAAGLSGLAFSDAGPLREVHDACTDDAAAAALWGFVAGDDAFRTIGPRERLDLVLAQLQRLFGPEAGDPVRYYERDWSTDPNTIDDEWFWVDGEPLGYGHPDLARPQLDGRLLWAGAETVAVGGGHMEGAVRSGHRAARSIVEGAGG